MKRNWRHHDVDRRMRERLKPVGRRNLLQIAHFHGTPPPNVQDLLNSRPTQSITGTYSWTAPPANEVELNQFPLHIRPVVFWKHRDLRGKTNLVSLNGLAEAIQAHFAKARVRLVSPCGNPWHYVSLREHERVRQLIFDQLHIQAQSVRECVKKA